MGFLRRHGLVSRAGALFLGLFTASAALAVVTRVAGVATGHAVAVGAVLWVVTFILASVLLPSLGDRYGLRFLGFLLAAALQFTVPAVLWSAVLAARGERTPATVVEVQVGPQQKVRHVYYGLVDESGRPIEGLLEQWPSAGEGAVGDRVVVVRDPDGLVGPRLPGEVADARVFWAVVPVLYLALVVVCMFLGRPPPPRVAAGPRPDRGPGPKNAKHTNRRRKRLSRG
ncbi:hypothetical protein ACFFX1_42820 [Dactylosporangium sucinum]|uniref:DUF3592 domain-containing protein n=1 Tax=Dactylosporangium sucinum TaxID=1424081 RepID=A0A917U0U2_9ACTN|nr:hypothetical protein [Dactylosporangium sucinum]GGM44636.1 hypothetical protein GCM10007977_052800 [Dactylosporangium sucinum]